MAWPAPVSSRHLHFRRYLQAFRDICVNFVDILGYLGWNFRLRFLAERFALTPEDGVKIPLRIPALVFHKYKINKDLYRLIFRQRWLKIYIYIYDNTLILLIYNIFMEKYGQVSSTKSSRHPQKFLQNVLPKIQRENSTQNSPNY